jgi:hypothetical protein
MRTENKTVRSAGAATPVFGATSPVVAEALHAVDPNTAVDRDTGHLSVRPLAIDPPEAGRRANCDRERALTKPAEDRKVGNS